MKTRLLVLVSWVVPLRSLKVMVTGAGGRTGKLVYEQLKAWPGTSEVVALARSGKGLDGNYWPVDVLDDPLETLEEAMNGCDAVVLCTSAVPKIKPLSILKLLWRKSILRRSDPGRPEFRFTQVPEEVDWLGAKKQIDAAKNVGVKHFVFVSSMGGTQPENFLNTIGRQDDGVGGDILLWKRKAERYLVACGMDFTIIHPGGLVDEEAGKRELLIDVDDNLLELKSRSIPRADVARICCAALFDDRAKNKSFDVASKPLGEGTPTADPKDLFTILGDKSADYDKFQVPDPPSILAEESLVSADL